MAARFLTATALLLLAAPVAAQPPGPPGPPAVVTNGHGIVERAPDRAVVVIATETRAVKPADAQQQNAAAMTKVQEAVKRAGIPADAVHTVGLSLQEEVEWSNGKRTSRGYLVANSIEVKVDDLTALGGLLDAAVAAGATDVGNVRFDLRDRPAAEREALRLAVADARARADAAAAGAGMRVAGILRIEDGGVEHVRPMPVMAMRANAGPVAAPTPVAAGQIAIEASVTVTAALEGK